MTVSKKINKAELANASHRWLITPGYLLFFSAVVIFIVATFIALWISLSAEHRSLKRQSVSATQQINAKVAQSIGMLHSMVASHQASSDGFSYRQFEMFSENLIENQSTIAATGRYDIVIHDDLDYFISELQAHGIFEFTPKLVTDAGNLVPLGFKPQYQLLTSFYPQDPVNASFIGLDLSEIGSTRDVIQRGVAQSLSLGTKVPHHWFSQGQINVFSPSYYGHYIPKAAEDRQLQTDGGYFITIDLEEIVTQSIDTDFSLQIGVYLGAVNSENSLFEYIPDSPDKRVLGRLFRSVEYKQSLVVGGSSATIWFNTPAGATHSQLYPAILKGLVALCLFAIFVVFGIIQHVSKVTIREKEKALAHERERALVTLNSLQDSVVTTDGSDKIDYLNPAAIKLLEADKDRLIGQPLQDVLDSYLPHPVYDLNGPDIEIFENNNATGPDSMIRTIKYGDESAVVNCMSSAITNSSEEKIGSVLTMRDITKEHALTTELAHQATHDTLTALPNRRKFESILGELLQNTETRNEGVHTVGYIDLDQFKLINDTVGHAAGDLLLQKLAKDLVTSVPDSVVIARLGGDEFGIICSGKDDNYVEVVANRLYEFFQNYFYKTELNIFTIRASIGITTIKPGHETINDVLTEVDIACYTAKDSGRNSYSIYNGDDQETRDREGEMLYLPILQSALKNDSFVLYTQPIASTKNSNTGGFDHYEILLRLIDENGDVITPFKFILAAERYDLIRDVDKWVVENACKQMAQFQDTPLQNTVFSINLSGQSAVDASMPQFIEDMLNKYQIRSSCVCFELTETAVISNLTQAQKLITYLRSRGCTIALDDFGAGASSFGYLKNLEVDYLKIDGQFVKEITSNKVDFEMVRSMNNVGKALGIKTIAEFVENDEILQSLRELEVDFAQGYFIGKPEPIENLTGLDDNRIAA